MTQGGRPPTRPAYRAPIVEEPREHPAPVRWLVDGNNVMGSRPDGWWRDRPGAARRLVAALRGHDWPEGTRVTVVFDGGPPRAPGSPGSGGRAPAGEPDGLPGPVEVVYAGPGPTADDRLVDEARAAAAPVTAVTSDRELARRLREVGASVVSAGRLLALLEGGGSPPRR